MTETPVTKKVQLLVRRYYCGPVDRLSLVGLIAIIFYCLWQLYPYGYSLFTEFTPGSYLGFFLIGRQYCVVAFSEIQYIFCRIRYKKINAVCIVEKPNELIFGRAIYMIALALAVIFKASKAFFVDLQAALAVNYIIYHLLLTGTIAIFTYLLDITYLQEHSEDFHDLVQNDLESRAGLEAIKQIVWKFSGIQTAPNGTNNKPPGEDSANNLDPEPTSQAK